MWADESAHTGHAAVGWVDVMVKRIVWSSVAIASRRKPGASGKSIEASITKESPLSKERAESTIIARSGDACYGSSKVTESQHWRLMRAQPGDRFIHIDPAER